MSSDWVCDWPLTDAQCRHLSFRFGLTADCDQRHARAADGHQEPQLRRRWRVCSLAPARADQAARGWMEKSGVRR